MPTLKDRQVGDQIQSKLQEKARLQLRIDQIDRELAGLQKQENVSIATTKPRGFVAIRTVYDPKRKAMPRVRVEPGQGLNPELNVQGIPYDWRTETGRRFAVTSINLVAPAGKSPYYRASGKYIWIDKAESIVGKDKVRDVMEAITNPGKQRNAVLASTFTELGARALILDD